MDDTYEAIVRWLFRNTRQQHKSTGLPDVASVPEVFVVPARRGRRSSHSPLSVPTLLQRFVHGARAITLQIHGHIGIPGCLHSSNRLFP